MSDGRLTQDVPLILTALVKRSRSFDGLVSSREPADGWRPPFLSKRRREAAPSFSALADRVPAAAAAAAVTRTTFFGGEAVFFSRRVQWPSSLVLALELGSSVLVVAVMTGLLIDRSAEIAGATTGGWARSRTAGRTRVKRHGLDS